MGSGLMIKKKHVKVGGYYAIKHTSSPYGKLSIIRIDGESMYGGWNATNLRTKRQIRIRSNTKLRYEVVLNPHFDACCPDEMLKAGIKKWLKVEEAA